MKECYICKNQIEIDWKDAELLRRFMSSSDYKILSPRQTGACAKHQRRIAKAIKRAREMGIVPYTSLVER
jgi:small subunit ribosomal protein S18